MSDEIETIDKNPKSWAAWKREAERLQAIIDDMALPAMDSEPVAVIDLANLDYLLSGADADVWPPEREEMGDVLLYRHAQPAPVVPDEIKHRIGGLDWGWEGEFNRGWNACRAAMLNGGKS
ncbi:hypothetical protein AB0200_05220 [Klebsiella pneumoniae]